MSASEESLRDILAGSSGMNPVIAKVVATDDKAVETAKAVETEAAATSAAKADAGAEAKVDKAADAKAEVKPRDESGRFQKTVPQEALHAERRKRQELEQKLAEREAKPPPSVLEDEDAAFNARLSQATQPLQAKLFRLSVNAARNRPGRDDFDDVSSAFMEAADKDPQLMRSFRDAEDPGEYAYSVGKQIKELADVDGDILKYGEKKSAETRAELDKANERIKALEAEVASSKANKAALDDVPRSLNGNASAAPRSVAETDDEPVSAIARFGNKQR